MEKLQWEFCGETPDGAVRTYCAQLEDGKMYMSLTQGFFSARSVAMEYVPDEVYVVNDTDYSTKPGSSGSSGPK